ncbi:hypothetical protein FB451DRAFT_1385576 [Mycena latifolia]|nr:hypothetical protein FB451DRAFT_1385576 [Mycena latifolia]
MEQEQPHSGSYHPKTSAPIEFQHTWRAVRVNPRNLGVEFPFRLPELVENRHPIHFIEFRASCDPPPDLGNPGDIWLNILPASFALFALNGPREWVRWSGPTFDEARMIQHPYLPLYALWCTIKRAGWYHRDKLPADWTGNKLSARQELGGYHSAAEMMDGSVGVRLILLWEANEAVTEANAKLSDSSEILEVQLKAALGQLTSTSTISDTKDALIATLSSGIDYLLTERMKLARELFAAEERAAIAERKRGVVAESASSISEYLLVERTKLTQALSAAEERAANAEGKLGALSESQSFSSKPQAPKPAPMYGSSHYRDRCIKFTAPLLQAPIPTAPYAPSTNTSPLSSLSTLPDVHDRDPKQTSPPPAKRRKTHSLSTDLDSTAASSSEITTSPTFNSKHLDILYRTAEEGRSKHCRICLTLIPAEHAPLIAHALDAHPTECAIFARAPDEVLDANLKKFAEMDES